MSVNPFNLLKSAAWRFGFALRESGQALERVGCQLQGIYSHTEISKLGGAVRMMVMQHLGGKGKMEPSSST
jgi:hypothetical protein